MILYNRKEGDTAPNCQPDPYMIKARDGIFYMYTSGGHCFSSNELLANWKYIGKCLDYPRQKAVWAPSVIETENGYYMYYSSIDEGVEDEHQQTLRVAFSESPIGPFKFVKNLLPPFAIDPHVISTPSGLYIFYCNNDFKAKRQGTFILCDRMTNFLEVENNPQNIILPTIDEEIYQYDRFEKGKHWHTIEGAFYFYQEGIHYLMYSGACYKNPTYFIGYAVAEGCKDADLRYLEWKKYPNENEYHPLMKSNSFVEGIGHNSAIKEKDKWYVIYHGRTIERNIDQEEDTRIARIDEMKINGKILSVDIT